MYCTKDAKWRLLWYCCRNSLGLSLFLRRNKRYHLRVWKKKHKIFKIPMNIFKLFFNYLSASIIAWIPTQKLYVYQHFENYAIWYHAYQWNSYTKLGLPVYRQGRIFVFYKWTYLAFSLLKRCYNSVSLSTKRLPKIQILFSMIELRLEEDVRILPEKRVHP